MTSKPSFYDSVTQSIVAAIEAHPDKPAMPWHRDATAPLFMPANALTGNLYQGINTVVLWVAAEQQGYSNPVWGTYRQWAELGCQVRKGEKSTPVVFYKSYEVEPESENPHDDGKRRVARASAVFNCAQVDGFAEPAAVPELGPVVRNQMFDALLRQPAPWWFMAAIALSTGRLSIASPCRMKPASAGHKPCHVVKVTSRSSPMSLATGAAPNTV